MRTSVIAARIAWLTIDRIYIAIMKSVIAAIDSCGRCLKLSRFSSYSNVYSNMLNFIPFISFIVLVAAQNTWTVLVETSIFAPTSVPASIGDSISFTFLSGNNTVTQSSFDTPCTESSLAIDSGFVFVPPNATTFPHFSFSVESQPPFWFYSRQTGVFGAVQVAPRYEWRMTLGSGAIYVGSERINVVAHILRGIPISKADIRKGRRGERQMIHF